MKQIWTLEEIAALCKVAHRSVIKWFDSGMLRGYRVPGTQTRRVPKEYLVRFMKEYAMPQDLINQVENGPKLEEPEVKMVLNKQEVLLILRSKDPDLLNLQTRLKGLIDQETPWCPYCKSTRIDNETGECLTCHGE